MAKDFGSDFGKGFGEGFGGDGLLRRKPLSSSDEESYEQIERESGYTLGEFGRDAGTAGFTALAVFGKVLETPRILITDIVGNLEESVIEAGIEIHKGQYLGAAKAFLRNLVEVVTDVAHDYSHFESKRSGFEVQQAYYDFLGVKDEDAPKWLKVMGAVGWEYILDPTTYITYGAGTFIRTAAAKAATKGMSAATKTSAAKVLAGIRTLSGSAVGREVLPDVLRAKTLQEAEDMIDNAVKILPDNLVPQFTKEVDYVNKNFISSLADFSTSKESEKLFGFATDMQLKIGTYSPRALQQGKAAVDLASSNIDEMMVALKGAPDEVLSQAGLTANEIAALRNPVIFNGQARYGILHTAEDFKKIFDNVTEIGKVRGVDYLGKKTFAYNVDAWKEVVKTQNVDAIVDASRKFGGQIMFLSDMYVPNPHAHHFAFMHDIMSFRGGLLKNPELTLRSMKAANNYARFIGADWYANPIWWGKQVFHPLASGRKFGNAIRGSLKVSPSETLNTLYGDVNPATITDLTQALGDAKLGIDPRSLNPLERMAGEFITNPNLPQWTAVMDEAWSISNEAYAGVVASAKNAYNRLLDEAGDLSVIKYIQKMEATQAGSGLPAVTDMVQMSSAQEAAYNAFRRAAGDDALTTEGFGQVKKIMRRLEEYENAEFFDDIPKAVWEELNIQPELAKQMWRNREGFKDVFAGVYRDLLVVEGEIGQRALDDVLDYHPIMLNQQIFDVIEESLEKSQFKGIIESMNRQMNVTFRDFVETQLLTRGLKSIPVSLVNEAFQKKGVEGLMELGLFQEIFGSVADTITSAGVRAERSVPSPSIVSDAAQEVIRNAVETWRLKNGGRVAIIDDNTLQVMGRRLSRFKSDVMMNNLYGQLEQMGLVVRSGDKTVHRMNEAYIRGLFKGDPKKAEMPFEQLLASLTEPELAKAVSSSDTGRSFILNRAEAEAAQNLGYFVRKDGDRYIVNNLAPKHLSEIAKDRLVEAVVDGKNVVLNLKTGQMARLNPKVFTSESVSRLSERLAQVERAIVDLDAGRVRKGGRAAAQFPKNLPKGAKVAPTRESLVAEAEKLRERLGDAESALRKNAPDEFKKYEQFLVKKVRQLVQSDENKALRETAKKAQEELRAFNKSANKEQTIESAREFAESMIGKDKVQDWTDDEVQKVAKALIRERRKALVDNFKSARNALQNVAPSRVSADIPKTTQDDFLRLQDFDDATPIPMRFDENATSFFLRLPRKLEGATPIVDAPRKGYRKVVSQSQLVGLIQAGEELAEADRNWLWDFARTTGAGFREVNIFEEAKLLEFARQIGKRDLMIDEMPDEVLKAIHAENVKIRAAACSRPPKGILGFASKLSKLIALDRLWGMTTVQANMIGNAIFAAQGGMTFNPLSLVRGMGMYSGILLARLDETPAIIGRIYRYGDKLTKGWMRDKTGKWIDEYQDALGMTIRQFKNHSDATGVTQSGWLAEIQRRILADPKKYEKWGRPAVDREFKQVMKEYGIKGVNNFYRTMGGAGTVISLLADDSWRFLYVHDLMVNKGLSLQEATKMALQTFGDFSALRATKMDKDVSNFFLFYRFRKWNIMNQMRVMAKDPKWAAFIGGVHRNFHAAMSDEEKSVAALGAPNFLAGSPVIAEREQGWKYDKAGKKRRAEFVVYNPFGSWYSPYDALQFMSNPVQEALGSLLIAADVSPTQEGIVESFINAYNKLQLSAENENPEEAAKLRMQAGAHAANASRILRYFRPALQGKEDWTDETYERLTRGAVFQTRLSTEDALRNARKKAAARNLRDEENLNMLFRIDRLLKDTTKLRRTRPYAFAPEEERTNED